MLRKEFIHSNENLGNLLSILMFVIYLLYSFILDEITQDDTED